MLSQLEKLDDLLYKRSAFQGLVLRLVVIRIHRVDRKHLFEIDDVRIFLIDLNRGRTPVDRLHRERNNRGRYEYNEKDSDDGPLSFAENLPVVTEMDLLLFQNQRSGVSGGKKLQLAPRSW